MVSIIVITYNQEKTIARTLNSILHQETQYPFEIIIGDDASTDGTRVICEEYRNKYPNIIKLNEYHPNYGVVKNYAEALKRCTGKYIMVCAGDDWLHHKKKVSPAASLCLRSPQPQ